MKKTKKQKPVFEEPKIPKPFKKFYITLPIFLVSTLSMIFLDIFIELHWSIILVLGIISVVSALYEPFLIIKKYCVPRNGFCQIRLFKKLKFDTSCAKQCMTSNSFDVLNPNKLQIFQLLFFKSGLKFITGKGEILSLGYDKVKFKVFVIRNHTYCIYPTPRLLVVFNRKDIKENSTSQKIVLELVCDNRIYNYIKHHNQNIYGEEKLKNLTKPFDFGKAKKRLKIVDTKHRNILILLIMAMTLIVATSITLGILFSYTIFFMSLLSAFVFLAMPSHIYNLYPIDLTTFDKYLRVGECTFDKDEFTELKISTFTGALNSNFFKLCSDYSDLVVPKNSKTEEFMKIAFPLLYLDIKKEEKYFDEKLFDIIPI